MKTLLLLGGGHSHVEVLRRFGVRAPRAARILLVSPGQYTAYSGMLPGLVAGHYAFGDCHIDLVPLCHAAQAEFRVSHACGLDPASRSVLLADGTTIVYDILSIDIGSEPASAPIAGAREHAIPIKPLATFLEAWKTLCELAPGDSRAPGSIAVIGGGAGGVEITLAMHHRLSSGPRRPTQPEFHIVTDSATVLPGYPPRARRIVERLCLERGITVHARSPVTLVEPGLLHRPGAAPIAADRVFLATGASAPTWLAASGVRTDARGFVAVNDALQSLSHPDVFAAGDIASMVNHPRPKSGVHAVRQGPPLADNLRRALSGRHLTDHVPQAGALALISTGGRHAIACIGGVAIAGAWVWQWKNWIDRRFVARYRARTTAVR